jgi:hypothetical protein
MALGALIAAYGEGEGGSLRALQPLAGRTLIEYQARCAAAAGAAPIVVLVERVPVALAAAFERLRVEGISVVPVSDGNDAATRFEPGTPILQMADGLAAAMPLVTSVVEAGDLVIATVPDDEQHEAFERIDATHRWAGLAIVNGATLSSTAAMLGDWDLQSTLLRRTVQAGARLIAAPAGVTPFLVGGEADPAAFDRHLLLASRQARRDWPSRYLFPVVEDLATERLASTGVRPDWLIAAALALTLAAALAFTRGWLVTAAVMLFLVAPLDLIAERLATLRLQPLLAQALPRRLLWPATGLAFLALGWFQYLHGGSWGSLLAALTGCAFAQALRIERGGRSMAGEVWLFDRRPACVLALPFAGLAAWLGAGWWDALLGALAVYAAASFFVVQHWVHRIARD